VNALTLQIKNEKTKMMFNEKNPLINIFNKNGFLYPIKKGDIYCSEEPLPPITPTYFVSWCDSNYSRCQAGIFEGVVAYNGYLYQPVRMFNMYDEWMGLLKYRASDGVLCDYEILTDESVICTGMVILDGYLYLCGVNVYGPAVLLKYNISGEDLSLELEVSFTCYDGGEIHQICADENNLYIRGYVHHDGELYGSLFLQKYNTDLEPIWTKPWDGPYDDLCYDMTFYDGYIFLTGSTLKYFGYEFGHNSFVLKFDSDGNLLEEIIGFNDDQVGVAIKGYEEKIYVGYNYVGILMGLYNVDFLISAYDTNLVNLWTSERYDYSVYDEVRDIVLVDDYIYLSGCIKSDYCSNGSIFKGSISNGEKIWWKVVDAFWTDANGICADDSYLYLSGTASIGSHLEAYILKCAFNGNSNPSSPDNPTITGISKGKPGVEYNYTFVSTNPDGVEMNYSIDWGDGSFDTTEFYPSGQEIVVSHTWSEKGSYTIRAKATTIYGYESGWGTLSVKMPLDLPGSHQSSPTPQSQPSHPISKTATQTTIGSTTLLGKTANK